MDTPSSVVYRLLPELIQRRVHKMPSVRRTMSWGAAKTTSLYDPLELPSTPPPPVTRPSTSDSDSSYTPPPSYRASRASTPYDPTPSGLSTPDRRHSQPLLASYGPLDLAQRLPDYAGSGIDWKYADQGMRMLDNSLQESWSAAAAQSSQSFPRQLYIHACTYLLRALPSDMSAEEAISIENSLPPDVKDSIARQRPCTQALALSGDGASCGRCDVRHHQGQHPHPHNHPQQQQQRSALHRAVAYLVLHAFLLVNMLLPYARLLIGHAYRFERRHRVSERAFAAGVQGVDGLGKRGLELSRRVAGAGDGRVGRAANDLVLWWVRGVTGGIHEGVGEGLGLVGVAAVPAGPGGPSSGARQRRGVARGVFEVR